jgi:DNA-binding transcriptional LysR family regulator
LRRIDWDDLRVFGSIVRGGSVRAAAKDLGIHHSTVARRLENLEERLGVHLFTRTPLGLRLTEEGHAVLGRTERVESEIDSLERRLHGQDQRLEGLIRVTLPDALGVGFLMDELGRFSALYPGIDLELLATYEPLDLGRREADMAIRITASPPDFLVGRNLGPFVVALYASPAYLQTHDPIGKPEACSWIGVGDGPGADAEEWRDPAFASMPSRIRSRNVLLRIAAVRAGAGVSMLPCVLCDDDPSLVRVPGVDTVVCDPIWALTHPDLRGAARIRALMSFLAESFERHRGAMMGELDGNRVAPLVRQPSDVRVPTNGRGGTPRLARA